MSTISINQAVDVHWRLPEVQPASGPVIDNKVTRTFANLIPACEFAVAMAKEGNLDISLVPDRGPVLALADAQRIADVWEGGSVSLDAEEMEY